MPLYTWRGKKFAPFPCDDYHSRLLRRTLLVGMYDPENIASLLHGESMRTAFIYYLQVSCPQSLRSYIQALTDPSLLQVAEDMNESV